LTLYRVNSNVLCSLNHQSRNWKIMQLLWVNLGESEHHPRIKLPFICHTGGNWFQYDNQFFFFFFFKKKKKKKKMKEKGKEISERLWNSLHGFYHNSIFSKRSLTTIHASHRIWYGLLKFRILLLWWLFSFFFNFFLFFLLFDLYLNYCLFKLVWQIFHSV